MEEEKVFHLKPVEKNLLANILDFKKETPILFWIIITCTVFYTGSIIVAVFLKNSDLTNTIFIILFGIGFILMLIGCIIYRNKYTNY